MLSNALIRFMGLLGLECVIGKPVGSGDTLANAPPDPTGLGEGRQQSEALVRLVGDDLAVRAHPETED